MTNHPNRSHSWWRFGAYNSQALYGYGTTSEAMRFADDLNRGRVVNVYHAQRLKADEATELRLDDNTEAFNLDDELAARAGIR